MATEFDDPQRLQKAPVIGPDGAKVGTVDAVYYDNVTDRPAWVAVRTGFFGTHVSLVPLAGAQLVGDALHVPFGADRLKRAPHHDPGRELTQQDEIDLYRHYGVHYEDQSGTPTQRSGPGSGTDDAMTRSEEQLRVRTEQEAERVRLRKHVVTEYRQITVPVRREVLKVEQGPADTVSGPADAIPANAAAADPGAADPPRTGRAENVEREIVLHEERPVVHTETVPVERVRLGKETVTEQETVGGDRSEERRV